MLKVKIGRGKKVHLIKPGYPYTLCLIGGHTKVVEGNVTCRKCESINLNFGKKEPV